MGDKVSRRLSYDPTPNMAGLVSDSIPPAPAPIPAFAEGQPSLPAPAPLAPRVSRGPARAEPSPMLGSTPPVSVPPQNFYEESEHDADIEADYHAERTARAAPRTARAPKAPRATPRQPPTARSASVVNSEARIRRTLRIPKSFDKKLRELASLLGVNLNSAILAAVEAEWQRRAAERRRA